MFRDLTPFFNFLVARPIKEEGGGAFEFSKGAAGYGFIKDVIDDESFTVTSAPESVEETMTEGFGEEPIDDEAVEGASVGKSIERRTKDDFPVKIVCCEAIEGATEEGALKEAARDEA